MELRGSGGGGPHRVATFKCPSDELEEVNQNPNAFVAWFEYIDQTGYNGVGNDQSAFGPAGVGLTNYLGVAGLWGDLKGYSMGPFNISQYKGPMLNVSRSQPDLVTLDAVTAADGTANTLLFGETLGSTFVPPTNGLRDYGFAWIGAGILPTAAGIPTSLSSTHWFDWSSKHSGSIVNFVMGDGSVRSVRAVGRDESDPAAPIFHNPPSGDEQAFIAASGFADGDTTKADGVN